MFLEVVAGTMAPDVEAADASNWNTSVHIPALNIGPENSKEGGCYAIWRKTLNMSSRVSLREITPYRIRVPHYAISYLYP